MELTQRQNEILKTLLSNTFVSIKDLVDSFDISVATLKNDIDFIIFGQFCSAYNCFGYFYLCPYNYIFYHKMDGRYSERTEL